MMESGWQPDRGTVKSFAEMDEAAQGQKLSFRQRAFEIFEHSRRRDFASRVIDDLLVILILGNVAVVVAETIPEVANQFGNSLFVFDRICVLVFAVEYAARIWVAPEHPMLSDERELFARVRLRAPVSTMRGGIIAPTFPQRSLPWLLTKAACGGLG